MMIACPNCRHSFHAGDLYQDDLVKSPSPASTKRASLCFPATPLVPHASSIHFLQDNVVLPVVSDSRTVMTPTPSPRASVSHCVFPVCQLTPAITPCHSSGGIVIANGSSSSRSSSPETCILIPTLCSIPTQPAFVGLTEEMERRIMERTKRDLEVCGWYYGDMTYQQANDLLKNTKEGTFLVRNSASGYCFYSLSVQTCNGVVSARIEFQGGKFRFDGHAVSPECDGVVQLLQHYMDSGKDGSESQVWLNRDGRTFCPIKLVRPFVTKAPSLKHLCRLVVNERKDLPTERIPLSLQQYLHLYAHKC